MSLRINSEAPDFHTDSSEGFIHFHEWIGSSWAVLFSHPKDYTPVCTTELGYVARLQPEFRRRNTKVIGLSVDELDRHHGWREDIEETQGYRVDFPIIADPKLVVAKLYGMLPESVAGDCSKGTVADFATVRTVFVIGPDKRIKAMLAYPMSSGRNFEEILRLLDACQLTERFGVATPVNWRPGEDVIIPTSVTDEQAKVKYPQGWKTLKPYLRYIPSPER